MREQTLTIKLHDKQRWAFYSPATEILYGGAAGGGKSFLLRVSGIRWCENVPGVQVYLFRRTFPDLRDNHLRGPKNLFELLAPSLSDGSVVYNKKDNEFIWVKTKSRFVLCHCQHEDDVVKYQGAEIHVLLPDELTHFTEYQYRFLRSRVRCVGIKIPEQFKSYLPRIEAGSNPGSVGHKWVKEMFIHEPFKIWKANEKDGGMLRQYVPAKVEDNPTMMEEDPQYLDRLSGLGSETLVRAMRDADWEIFAGQYFSEWRREHHIYEPFDIPKEWPRIRAIDWGYSDPLCCLWGAIGNDNHIWIYRELYKNRLTDSEYAEQINSLSKYPDGTDERIEYTVGDPGSFWVKNPDTGVARWETYALNKVHIIKADNSRVNGWSRVREYLKLRDYQNGLTPWVHISRDCTNLIRTLPELVHDQNKVEDIADGMEDHAPDSLRYLLQSRPPIFQKTKIKKYQSNLEAAFAQAEKEERRNKSRLWK